MNPKGTTIAKAYPNLWSAFEYLLLNPIDWNEELKPCHKCNDNNKKERLYRSVRTGLTNL